VRSDAVVAPRPCLWRVSDRATFLAFRAGRRVRRGAVSVTFVPPPPTAPTEPPRVAFAVGKGMGGAVVRNRARRRLRAAVRELQRQERLPTGAYLLGATAELAHLPWSALVSDVDAAIRAATEGAA
jgi:ribonuclease P protein component